MQTSSANRLMLSAFACLLLSACNANAQTNLSPPPHPRRTLRQPYFINFDVDQRVFLIRQGGEGSDRVLSGDFTIAPNDLVYFRASHFNNTKLKVRLVYQPVPPQRVALPTPFTTALASVSSANPSAATDPINSGGTESGSTRGANRLHDLLTNALQSYNPASTDAFTTVESTAKANLKNYLMSDVEAQKALAKDHYQDSNHPLTANDYELFTSLPNGVHTIYVIGEEIRNYVYDQDIKRVSKQEAGRNAARVYNRYVQAADLWRQIVGHTFFQTSLGPVLADDTVGQMALRVEISDITPDNAAVTPYTLNLRKNDRRNIEFAVSANVVGSLLRDDSYYKDSSSNIQRQSRNDFTVTTGAFVHALLPGNSALRYGFSFGITPETNPKYMIGGSLLAGHDQRIIVTMGIISGQVARLSDGLKIGNAVPASGNIPTQSVTRSAFFFSLGFKF